MAESAHLELLFENNPLPMWVFDLETLAFLAVNQAAIVKYGYSRDEFLRMTLQDIRPPEDIHALLPETRFRNTGLKTTGQWRHLRKDGTLINVEIAAHDFEWQGRRARLVVANDITERKRAEDAFQAERELLRTLIDNMPDYIYVKDASGRFVVANRALADLVGARTPEDLLGKTDFDFYAKELATTFFADEQAIIQSGKALVGKIEAVVDSEANAKWLSTSKVPLRDKRGQVVGIMGISRDVTNHKSAEDALRESNQFLEALVDASPAGIVCVDRAGKVTLWNPAAERIFGWSEQELLGQPLPVVPEDKRKMYGDLRASVFLGESVSSREVRARRKDGSTFDAIVSLAPLRNADGEIRGAMDIALDITSSKQAEAQLRLQAVALEIAANAVVITDRSGTILWVNPAFTALTGYSSKDAVGKTFRLLNSGKHPKSFFEQMWKTILAGRVWHGEVINRRKDSALYTGEQTITPVRNERGEITRFVAIMQDVTERKQLAQQLSQAQKMESVGRLAGGVAHDFSNLLSVIIGYSDVLLMRPELDPQAHRQIDEIKRAGNRAASLTRQLLAFSRQQVLEPRILNLNSIVTDTEKMLRRLIGEDIEFQTKLDPDLGSVRADPGQVEQIIMNLAVNARDAMPDGGKFIIETSTVELDEDYALHHPPSVPGRYVLLSIADTGVGMDQETKAHIFEPFFTTKEPGKGTGLELSTVYGIVKQSGGYIWPYSEPGYGTQFKIYLPLVDRPAQRIPPAELPSPDLGRSETVLLVEDEESLRTLIRCFLEEGNYTVLEGTNGVHACEVARQYGKPIHLLLTDVVMPQMSGPILAATLAESQPDMKVLYMSGYAGRFGSDRGLLDSGSNLLPKPFSRVTLLRKLREVLQMPVEAKLVGR